MNSGERDRNRVNVGHERGRHSALRISMGVVSGLSLANIGLSMVGIVHEPAARDVDFKAAAGIERQVAESASPEARRVLLSQIGGANRLLDSRRTGYQASQPLAGVLSEERIATPPTGAQRTQLNRAEKDIAAGNTAENNGNIAGESTTVSMLTAVTAGVAASGAFGRRRY